MKKLYLLLLSILLISILYGCENKQNTKVNVGEPSEEVLEISKELEGLPGEGDFYTQFVDDSNGERWLHSKTNVISTDEPIFVSLHQIGKDRNMKLIAFYDYKQVKFSVENKANYQSGYIFEIGDNQEINIPIYLDNSIKVDDKIHSIIFAFVSGPDLYSSNMNLEEPEYSYGMSASYNVAFNDITADCIGLAEENIEYIKPDNIFDIYWRTPILNTDFSNKLQKDNNIKYPDIIMEAKAGEKVEMMYNISAGELERGGTNKSILLLMIDYEQVNINDYEYFLVDIEPNTTVNGKLYFYAPNEPGDYEVIYYSVDDPFSVNLGYGSSIESGYRFTLRVS